MNFKSTHVLCCQHEGCLNCGPSYDTKDEAWKDAQAEGWYIDAHTALCPEHWPQAPDEPGCEHGRPAGTPCPHCLELPAECQHEYSKMKCVHCGEHQKVTITSTPPIRCTYCGHRAVGRVYDMPVCIAHYGGSG